MVTQSSNIYDDRIKWSCESECSNIHLDCITSIYGKFMEYISKIKIQTNQICENIFNACVSKCVLNSKLESSTNNEFGIIEKFYV